ncbi:K Homology domain, type 1 [Cinara cedri]|uniref:K Homology domain, type 1 n=1 Tax=Cinara cedri TaxID=506608 RepID=A0A5E4M8M5_9HEMI|nr:K Homology domain, type 1 [Cinara cedri]
MAVNNYLNTFPELNKLSQNLEAKTVKRYTSNINQAFTVSIIGKKFDNGKVVDVANAKSFCKKIIIDTGVHIEISTTKTKADMTFILNGKQTNVEEAKKRIVSSIQTQVIALILEPL